MLTAVQAMVAELPTVISSSAAIYVGVPESFAARINVVITLGPATPNDSIEGAQEWEPVVTVAFGYRVSAVEQTAELVIADLILELVNEVLVNDPTIGGTVDPGRVRLSMAAASSPQYQAVAGAEARLYPVMITGFQQRYL